MPVVVQENAGVIGTVGSFVSPLLHPLATTGLVLIFVIFTLAAREDLRNRFIRLLGTEDIQHTTAVIDDAGRRQAITGQFRDMRAVAKHDDARAIGDKLFQFGRNHDQRHAFGT